MVPVDERLVVSIDWLVAQMDSMINAKQILLGMDCKDKNVLGFSYDTGYVSALLELKKIVLNPPKEADKDPNEEDEDD
jgi:hypothetical protein